MTKTITITDLAQVRDGDNCTVEIEGRQYTGPAYAGEGDILLWGGHALRYSNGEPGILFDWLGDKDITRWRECDVTPRGEVIGQ